MKKGIKKYKAIVPERVTQSFLNFAYELQHSEFLLLMFIIGGEYIIENKEKSRQALLEIYGKPEDENTRLLIEYFKSGDSDKVFDIRTYEIFYGQMCYARTIDNVLTYFKEILSEVIIKKPEMLKSKETERLDFILNFDNMDELKIALSEKKIESLFYAGIDTIESFFDSRLGIKLFKKTQDKRDFDQIVKNRNTIVHNRGRITKEYIKQFPDSRFKEGTFITFSYEDISTANLLLNNFIVEIDKDISMKFNLNLLPNK